MSPLRRSFNPFRLLLVSAAGWLSQQQRDAIDSLREENWGRLGGMLNYTCRQTACGKTTQALTG
jgi:hypothetical protein